MTFTMDEYRIARAHAGYSYDPARETAEQGRVRSHVALARSIYAYRTDPDAYVDWQPSAFAWDGDVAYDGPLWDATLYLADRPVASLCCIAAESHRDAYCRAIEGELYSELEDRRDSAAVRSVN